MRAAPASIQAAGEVSSHPRALGWVSTTALAMGGSNQSLFLIGALIVGQGDILGQGSAAVPLLILGLLMSWAAAPGWTELVLMYPNRVGGISASCAEAFRPYSAVLANLTGVCYWWGWVPTCGLTAILSASALHHWYLPGVPVNAIAVSLVLFFTAVNLCGVRWIARLAVPVATMSAALALISGLAPIIEGSVDWQQAMTFDLTIPYPGWFGELTSLMAGLYLIGFAAPAFEAAACHVGETRDPNRNVPRAMFASGAVAGIYFILLPVVWLGTLGAPTLGKDLALVLGPTFAPLFGSAAKAAAIWFMMLSMFSGTLQPLAGAARTLAQLSEDGLLPRILARRLKSDAPWAATLLTAAMAILFLLIGDPIWLIAAANFTYLIGIALPSVAVWLLRRDAPDMARPYRAPRGTVTLGLIVAIAWACTALLGFEQFGLPTVVIGVAFAYAGSALYAWRRYTDMRRSGEPIAKYSLQVKLTGAMLLVLLLDGTGYLLAVNHIEKSDGPLLTALSDIFVAVAMLSITVALVLPGMIAHSASQVSDAARRLAAGTLAEFSRAMTALGRGDIDAAHAHVDIVPVRITSRDEVGAMAESFNLLQQVVGEAASGLVGAREGLQQARGEIVAANLALNQRVEELDRAEEKLSSILNSIENVVWSVSALSLDMLYVNPAVERSHGMHVAALMADPQLWMKLVHPVDRPRVSEALWGLAGTRACTIQYRILRPDGEIRWIEDRVRMVFDTKGAPLRIDGVAIDISERKLHEIEMNHLANHDLLTSLPNRKLLADHIDEAIGLSHVTGRPFGVLFLDLDGFKYVNDSLGHTLGDSVLKAVADLLRGIVRGDDTVARLGGDEFVILLWDVADAKSAEVAATKILGAFRQPLCADGHSFHITASMGISLYPADATSREQLLRHADLAMYRAKSRGRNGFACYSEDMSAQTRERLDLGNALREALGKEQFTLHYQPQIELSSGRIKGVEALLRWHHPEFGPVSPARFIPVAEDSGLILPIGEWALRTACMQLRAWHAAGHPDLTMAVNLSARQVQQQDLPQLVRKVLRESGIPASSLELELTESVLMGNSDAAVDALTQLKDIGVELSLDDFGTGYSSLSYLKRFPIDIIKIDQSFTADLTHSADAASICNAIIAMARSLGLRTVAEGVETEAQLRFLSQNGCDDAQGFHFSRALPADELGRLLDQHHIRMALSTASAAA